MTLFQMSSVSFVYCITNHDTHAFVFKQLLTSKEYAPPIHIDPLGIFIPSLINIHEFRRILILSFPAEAPLTSHIYVSIHNSIFTIFARSIKHDIQGLFSRCSLAQSHTLQIRERFACPDATRRECLKPFFSPMRLYMTTIHNNLRMNSVLTYP